jgi:drug/metabolite transporter (DMT)-like permease
MKGRDGKTIGICGAARDSAASSPSSSQTAVHSLKTSIPRSVVIGLWLAIVLDTGVQLCWKLAVLKVPESAGFMETVAQTLRQPFFIAAISMFAAQFINWMHVLSKADLSYAQPITALSYVSVAILSAIYLNETVSPVHMAGIVLILLGVWFISNTDHRTTPVETGTP